jgi:putative spermidine/putrescine transport system permease protein
MRLWGRLRRPGAAPWGLAILPAVAFLALFFLLPLGFMLWQSLTVPAGIGLGNYVRFFDGPVYVRALITTVRIAALTTAVCLLIGYPFAFLLSLTRGRVAALLLLAILLPFWSSLLVKTYAWTTILRDTGVINDFLQGVLGFDEPVPLIRTTGGVLVGMTHILLPYMVLPIYGAMRSVDPDLVQAASNLGAGRFRTFRRVYLPLTLSGVWAGSLLVFVLALGFYVTPELLGSPSDSMLSQVTVNLINVRLEWGFGSAVALILLFATLLVLALAARIAKLPAMFEPADEA